MNEVEMLLKRVEDLDRRVKALEDAQHSRVWEKEHAVAEDLIRHYGEYVDKTVAAKLLGVTRATVYAMLADGRVEGACGGKRVSTVSIARYMSAPKTPVQTKKAEGSYEDPESGD